MVKVATLLLALVSSLALFADDWRVNGHDAGGTKHSALTQINPQNVTRLQVAWTYRTGDLYLPKGGGRPSSQQTVPLYVDNTLYVTSAFGRVIALDPETGKPKWSFDPKTDVSAGWGDFANRGVATWLDPKRKADEPCRQRIFVAPIDARLFAIDAANGAACADFGEHGVIDLRQGLRRPPRSKDEYQTTSPPAVLGELVIIGSSVADNNRTVMPSGEVRAFDARTGKLRWTWHSLPADLEAGAGNAWSLLSVDEAKNLVFVPTGSASPDYYGGQRPGDNRFANSVTALDGKRGKVVWSFQTVHHDLWDYDVASQPLLFTMRRGGHGIPAVAIGSKTGHLFLVDRYNGKPLFPVEERLVPASTAEGEKPSPTQPFPVLPPALVPQKLREEDAWGSNEDELKWCRERIRALRSEGIFTPPSVEGSVIFPGNIGGLAWGGAAWDPKSGYLIVPTNRIAAVIQLIPRAQFQTESQRKDRLGVEFAPQHGTPYGMSRQFLLSPSRCPCNAPPWGALSAVDTKTGKIAWEVPLGKLPWLEGSKDAAKWGSINLGGPITTASGLIFIGATLDPYLRAFETTTGRELWKGKLPDSARSTPMTYQSPKGKQFVVISANGHNIVGGPHDEIVAFALPD
jgi:quinoprotein glucose dehydrogenase